MQTFFNGICCALFLTCLMGCEETETEEPSGGRRDPQAQDTATQQDSGEQVEEVECSEEFLAQYDTSSLAEEYAPVVAAAESYGVELATVTEEPAACLEYKDAYEVQQHLYEELAGNVEAAANEQAIAAGGRVDALRWVTFEPAPGERVVVPGGWVTYQCLKFEYAYDYSDCTEGRITLEEVTVTQTDPFGGSDISAEVSFDNTLYDDNGDGVISASECTSSAAVKRCTFGYPLVPMTTPPAAPL